jgi:hypothetical protein
MAQKDKMQVTGISSDGHDTCQLHCLKELQKQHQNPTEKLSSNRS